MSPMTFKSDSIASSSKSDTFCVEVPYVVVTFQTRGLTCSTQRPFANEGLCKQRANIIQKVAAAPCRASIAHDAADDQRLMTAMASLEESDILL